MLCAQALPSFERNFPMDKRRKPLTAYEQLELREKLDVLIAEHPECSVPQMLRQARTLLRLTLEEMAQLAGITVLTLKRIEAGTSSPSLRTIEQLLRPLGLKLAIVKRSVSAEKPVPV
jgi:DNA-binding XRE family transcriptional regulator